MTTGLQRLHLEDALDDSPQTRSLLGVFTTDASQLHQYSSNLHKLCQSMLDAQTQLCLATQQLSQHVRSYEDQPFPLEVEDSILGLTMRQFSATLDDLSSVQQVLVTQLQDTVMYPIGKFLHADLEDIKNLGEMLNISREDHEASLVRNSKLTKRKGLPLSVEDPEKIRQESVDEVCVTRRKLHQTSLHYFAALNHLQYKRKVCLLEPLLGYVQAVKSATNMAADTLKTGNTEELLSNTEASIHGVQRELNAEKESTVLALEKIEIDCGPLYHPDSHKFQANSQLSQKGGYLFMRSKNMLTSRWERCYFFTQGGNLMCQRPGEFAGSLVLDLNDVGTFAGVGEADDRRHLLCVNSPGSKRVVVLQAENDRERDEWIHTVNNIVQHSGYIKDPGARPTSLLEVESPPNTPVTTDAGFMPDAPIQFDIITPSEERKVFRPGQREGPPMRINPFHESTVEIVNANNHDNSDFYQTFEVRFLGSMQVKTDKGDELICEAMRQILAARALHNIFRTTESLLVTSCQSIKLVDPATSTIRAEYSLTDVSYWSSHNENKRLFGFISRALSSCRPMFNCHVFECNMSADEVCLAFDTGTQMAYNTLLQNKGETPLLTEQEVLALNLAQLEDRLSEESLSSLTSQDCATSQDVLATSYPGGRVHDTPGTEP